MEGKYIKYLDLSVEDTHFDAPVANKDDQQFMGKWVSYFLMAAALILWMVFNIVSIDSLLLPPYLLVVMNLVLYFAIAVMVNPDNYADLKNKDS